MANRPPAAALAKRESKQISREIRQESFKKIRHLRHPLTEGVASQVAPDCSPPDSVSGNGVQDPSSPTMWMQSSIDRSSAPKRARRESVDPADVTTRRQLAEAFYRAQSPSSAAENLVLMTVPLTTAFTGNSLVLVTNLPPSADSFRSNLILLTPAAFTDNDQNTDTSNVDTAPLALGAQSFESPTAGHLDSFPLSSLSLGLPESDDDSVAAFASRTAATPLLAVADAAVTADAPVGADSVSLAASLLNHRIGDALLTGFIVDDENPLPWLEELARSTSRHEHNLPLTGPTAGAWIDQGYEDDQMDMSFNSELSALKSEVDQPETLAEAEVDDATTYALAGSPGELNEVMDAAVGATFEQAMGAPMDASWAVATGDFRAAPGSCYFLNVVVLVPGGQTVAIVCDQHQQWVKSPAHHVVTKHKGVKFPVELFDNFTIATSWPQLDLPLLALPFVTEHCGVRCPVSNKIAVLASSLKCCDSRHSSESLVSVTVQRLGYGNWLKTVEVVSRGNAPVIPIDTAALEQASRAIAKARSAPLLVARTGRRKVSPMYQKLNWYTDEEQLSITLTSGLTRLFEVPTDVGDPARWTDRLESLLFDIQVYCNKFSPRFHARTDYSIVTDRTMRRYAEGITRMLNFVVNLVSRDDLDEHKVALPAGLADAVDRLKLSQIAETVFDLLQLVYAQKVDTKMNILRFMLKVFCVNPVTKSLRHPGELQAATSFVFRGGRLTVLILSAREVSDSCLTQSFAAASLPVVQPRDLTPPLSFLDEDPYDEDGYELEPQVPSFAEVTQCSNHEEGNFSDAVARRCVILHDNQYPIPVEVAVIKIVSMEFTTPTTPNIFVPVPTKVHLIIYKGVDLDLSLLPAIVKQMKSFAAEKLRDLLYGFICDLEVSCFQDNWVSPAIQSTKADELCNAYFRHLLVTRKRDVVAVGDEITFSEGFAQGVLEKSALLEETFLTLIHLTSGAPGRATELVDMRVTAHGDVQRNLFLAGREVYFAPNWSKNSGKCAPQQIYRFCDEVLSLLLLKNLMIIRPLLHAVAKQHVVAYNGKDFLELLFVRKGSSMNDHFFRATFVKTMTEFKFPILYNDARHIFAYLCKLTVGGEGTGDLGESLRVIAGQFGNKSKTLFEVYGRIRKPIEINNQRFAECHAITNHFRAILKALETPEDFLDAFTATNLGASSAPSLTALNEIKLSVMKLEQKLDNCIEDRASRNNLAQVEHGQQRSPFLTGADHQAETAHSDTQQLGDCRGKFDATDVAGIISFSDSHFGSMKIVPNRRPQLDIQTAQSNAANLARLALNKLMPAASWKSDGQRVAVQRVLQLSASNFLVVLPTSGGKSLVFQAYCVSNPRLLTVVFVPTVALQEGILQKVRNMQFKSSETLHTESQGLVVLTFASLRNQVVRRILDELTGKSLSRIFIDEVHDLLMQHWNNPFEYLPQLATRVQTVYMTATASREIRQALCAVFACGSAIAVVCEPTSRWNLHFEVRWIAGNARSFTGRVDALRTAINVLLSDLRTVVLLSKKAILFVSSQESVEDVRAILNGLGIKSTWYKGAYGVDQGASRRENAKLWLADVPVMVSTSAFSMGVDCADVTLVGVLECPYSIDQLAQMWGRAGRNGLAADCVLVLQKNLSWQSAIRKDRWKADVLDFALLDTCRQRCLATIFDVNCGPIEKPDCLDVPNAELCDNCESRSRVDSSESSNFEHMDGEENGRILAELRYESGTHVASDETRQRALKLRAQVVNVATFLPVCAGFCAICFAKTGQFSKHSYESCSNKKGICKFCFGAALNFVNDHESIACPFRRFVEGACVTCWCPLSVDNVGLHAGSPGNSCSAFNLKNWALHKICQTEGLQERSFWRHIDRYVRYDKERRQLTLEFFIAAKLVVDPDVLHGTGDPVETEFDTSQPVHEVDHVVSDHEAVDLDAILLSDNAHCRVVVDPRAASELDPPFAPIWPGFVTASQRLGFFPIDRVNFVQAVGQDVELAANALKLREALSDEVNYENCLDQRIRLRASLPASPLVEMRHKPTVEDHRVFSLITERTEVRRGHGVDASNLAVILQGVCAICFYAGKIEDHHHSSCRRRAGTCLCCFGLLLPDVGDHSTGTCPFKIRTEEYCYVCWFPYFIDDKKFHPLGYCSLFSLKLWHIQHLIEKHGKLLTSQLGDKIYSREAVRDVVKRFCAHFAQL